MTIPHAHVLDQNYDGESITPRTPWQQELDGPVRQSRLMQGDTLHDVRRSWANASPGRIRGILDHYDQFAQGGVFTVRTSTGQLLRVVYAGQTRAVPGTSGYGSIEVSLEQVNAWD